jgi:putative hydrolase of the HAD superfamily
MSITTVFFDVGNTLLTPALTEGKVLTDAAASLGAHLDPAFVEQKIPLMYQYYEKIYEADNSLWANEERAVGIWQTLYEHLCGLIGIPQLGAQIAKIGYKRFLDPSSWALFDDVLPTLSALKSRNITLGLISNWDNSLESIIKGMGLESYFDIIISSATVGLYKPQPEIFELALSKTGACASESMHIGDHLQADVGGAAGVGITPVLIDRNDRHENGEGYLRAQNLQDILEYL